MKRNDGGRVVVSTPRTRVGASYHLTTYGAYYGILLAHYLPAPLNSYGVIASFVATVWVMLARSEVDIYKIFLLLLPAVGLYSEGIEADWFITRILRVEKVSTPVGMFPLTTPTALAVTVPFRVLLYRSQSSMIIKGLWWPCFALSVAGLIFGLLTEASSETGITVGVRSALAFGAVLISYRRSSSNDIHSEIRCVVLSSLVLFSIGALQNHWMFIAVSLVPCLFLYFGKGVGALTLVLLLVPAVVRGTAFSFTLAGVMLVSILLCALAASDKAAGIMRRKVCLISVFVLPALLTLFVIKQGERDEVGTETLEIENLAFKVWGDRKPIWDAAYEQIVNSPYLLVAPGRPLYFRNLVRKEVDAWDWGAHNIFLEVFRQIGALASVFGFAVVGWAFVKAGNAAIGQEDRIVFWSLTSVYLVFGMTGNTLSFAGTGLLFWFLVGALRSKVGDEVWGRRVRPQPSR